MSGKPQYRAKDKGAVLLTTLLVMSLMATVAVSLFEDLRFAVKRAANVQAYAQADWYLRGADDVAQDYLERQLKQIEPSDLNAVLYAVEPIIFPIEGGEISMALHDGDKCFSLSALLTSPGRIQFRQLLEALGWDTLSAASLTSKAVDWIDAGSQALPDGAEDFTYLAKEPAHRTANTLFTSVSELRAIDGLTEASYQVLKPYICARPEMAKNSININALSALHAPVLASVIGNENRMAIALKLINDRPAAGYNSVEQLLGAPALSDVNSKNIAIETLDFAPNHIWAEVTVSHGDITRRGAFEYDISSGQPIRIFRRMGLDVRRAKLVEEPT
ncbi:type II secretion system minor pseudopilin GspK [Fretibacter rubidus]|uniref:type II secretion system minor pseudopilin GspK n=1 Tax=Fretibacter rubidus TaxID=570162 RepID=UPI00352B307B